MDNYRYQININQFAAIENGFDDLDIIDLAIVDFISNFSSSPKTKKMMDNGNLYFFISWKKVLEQLPLLKIKTRQGVYNRLMKLQNYNIIEPHSDNGNGSGLTWYCAGKNFDCMFIRSKNSRKAVNEKDNLSNEIYSPVNETLQPPVNETLHYKEANNIDKLNKRKEEALSLISLNKKNTDKDINGAEFLSKQNKKEQKQRINKPPIPTANNVKIMMIASDLRDLYIEETNRVCSAPAIVEGWIYEAPEYLKYLDLIFKAYKTHIDSQEDKRFVIGLEKFLKEGIYVSVCESIKRKQPTPPTKQKVNLVTDLDLR